MIWNPDVEIVYEAGTGPTNRGVTTGIQLTTGGIPSAKLLEFDDVQLVGDPASRADFEMLIREAIDDTPGVYEIVFAYDNLTGDFATGLAQGTIGVENFAGNRGTTYAYDDANLATLANGMAVCFNWQIPDGIGDYVITYQATVDAGVADGTVLTNVVEHDNDHAGTAVETSEASVTIALPATYGVELDAPTAAITGTIGTTVTYSLNITNTGSTTDTFDIAVTGNGWTMTAPADITLGAGETGSFDVTVAISGAAAAGDQDVATVAATSQMDALATASVDLTTTAEEMPATSYGIYLPLILKP
jgi:hypothetical protein